MAGFRRAKAEQAALKLGIYGATGRGKTFTALLIAEGLAKLSKKRIAYVDTEHGTDFYCKAVPGRAAHPDAFDFDAIYTRSLSETIGAIRGLDVKEYGVCIIDSITHMWEAAKAAYSGRTTKIGTIPFQAWGQIKRPYKELMAYLLNSPMHVIICGRQGNEYEEDAETEELKCVGTKMKAEGETPYEPHILIHLDSHRDKKGNTTITAFAEKDRTGVLAGKTIQLWPSESSTFDLLARPILPLLGDSQAQMETEDETAAKDGEAIAAEDQRRVKESERLLVQFSSRLNLCNTPEELKAVGRDITPEIKKQMVPGDVNELRSKYQEAERRIKEAS